MSSVFEPALVELRKSGRAWSEPEPFREYLRRHSLPTRDTASCVSVQSLGHLDGALRRENVMVFRLGAGTFALARAEKSVEEFFLVDEQFLPKAAETFLPDAAYSDLFPFKLLGCLTEVGGVNLALASGLLGYALGIDAPWPRTAPATSQSTYTFVVAPHSALDVRWDHRKGQVEIDALVRARRSGKWCLFVLEAKHEPPASLAKTKLVYPVAAVATMDLPGDVAIVPVYLRSWIPDDRQGVVRFMVAECEHVDPRQGPCPVNTMTAAKTRLLDLAL